MSENITIDAFHGTDKKWVSAIISDKFTYRKNKEHWLGNGVYFFIDLDLAKWWTTNPTKKFGGNIDKRAIIHCNISVGRDEVLDLRTLQDYKQFVDIYREEYLPNFFNRGIIFNKKIQARTIRCAYCDYLKTRYNLKMIIGTFYMPTQPYLPEKYGKLFNRFNISYIEAQICVFDQDIIKNKEDVSID